MNNQNYSYPLDSSWSTDEIIDVTKMFQLVEDAYETGVSRQEVLDQYQKFKRVVQSKSQEKQLGKQFEKDSGYVLYEVIKQARETESKKLLIRGN
ncbi:UPF0223 family protein [Paucilactobacillus suebicus]|uniref:Uncharacterized protein n=1 Tax=Paucilactobacillus suebicus DSM 5007 = KCTC 3549 TaxID=1423807 RepID=A0A0R1W9R3_9LACO|nr:UPF0223 family protein [Paucilactobacillus suebicus]KRM12523.1 hypothetical protein FD16_GL002274 [Paucilactobacillus suebicus DSM 5007 = KCTC 3549]